MFRKKRTYTPNLLYTAQYYLPALTQSMFDSKANRQTRRIFINFYPFRTFLHEHNLRERVSSVRLSLVARSGRQRRRGTVGCEV